MPVAAVAAAATGTAADAEAGVEVEAAGALAVACPPATALYGLRPVAIIEGPEPLAERGLVAVADVLELVLLFALTALVLDAGAPVAGVLLIGLDATGPAF